MRATNRRAGAPRLSTTLKASSKGNEDFNTVKIKFDDEDLVMELGSGEGGEIKLKSLEDTDYLGMKTMDANIKIDPSLKLGTGDDELVDGIVKSAKRTLGGVGALVPDKLVTSTLKGAKISNRKAKVETRNYVSNTRNALQKKLVDDEGLPLVYSQEGIQQYWSGKSGELVSRWTEFLSLSSPFLLRVLSSLATGRFEKNEKEITSDFR